MALSSVTNPSIPGRSGTVGGTTREGSKGRLTASTFALSMAYGCAIMLHIGDDPEILN